MRRGGGCKEGWSKSEETEKKVIPVNVSREMKKGESLYLDWFKE